MRRTPMTVCTDDVIYLGQMADMAGISPTTIRSLVDAGTVQSTRHPLGGYYFTPLQAGQVIDAVQAQTAS